MRLTAADDVPIEEVIARIVASRYLPTIAGDRATWSVTSNVPIAVVAQAWTAPRFLSATPLDPAALARQAGAITLYFRYHAQLDPEVVFATLR
jgi:hypothetical protein